MTPYVLRFLAIGALLLAAQFSISVFRGSPQELRVAPSAEIAVDSDRIALLAREAIADSGRPADSRELRFRAQQWIDDEILFREALALGLWEMDPVVRMRLVRNMRFILDDSERSDAQLFDEARELGMIESDLVVRRRLIQQMRFRLEASAPGEAFDDATLNAHLEENAERFALPARVRLSQLTLGSDERGEAASRDAELLREALVAENARPETSRGRGDPFYHAADFALQSEAQVAKYFGPKFARAVSDPSLPLKTWVGPIDSAYGSHVVWIHEREPARMPELESVRNAVEGDLLEQRRRARFAEALGRLRERYEVVWPEDPKS